MVGRSVAFVTLALAFAAAPCLAQDVTGPPVAAPSTTLYAHSGGGSLWMNTVMKDEDGTDATVTMAFPGLANTGSTANFKLLPGAPGPIELDTTADIEFNIRFGSGLLANYGTVSTKLMSGSTEIASAAAAATATANSYGDVKLTAKPAVGTLEAGQDLVWSITFSGEGSAYIQVSQDDQWCNLVLAILSPTADSFANVTGNATGNATGNMTGNATGNATGNSTGNSSSSTSPSATNGTALAPAGNGTAVPVAEAKGAPALTVAPLAPLLAWVAWRRRERR